MSLHRSSLMGAALALTTALTASAALAQTPVFPPAPRAETQTSQPDMAMVIVVARRSRGGISFWREIGRYGGKPGR